MSVSPLISAASNPVQGAGAAPAGGGSGNLGTGSNIDDITNSFMQLLVAQMQNQDPTNPMDNNQLTSQLAQFNTAAGVRDLNTELDQVGGLIYNMQQMNAAQWVGRKVYIEGDNSVSTSQDGNKDFSFAVDSDTDKVTVTLTDDAGNAYTADLKDLKSGVNSFSLDDLQDFKPSAPPADSNFKVTYSAANDDGTVPKIVSLKKSTVDGVSFSAQGAVLRLGKDGTTTLGDVYLIE
ncbi:flagellar biosynthesis protein FlgD [Pluralibacter gergoviae]|uniref:Basal-body rod modification protein FlgD n=2 Tax=Pluralibacter gergoviae TaxID=61647 RepID=A0AAI9DIV0_PLUGE|nr:flagellar hook capping FlgD N-terminal domain-containing protein [Pluralibacter gergoviae]AVR02525.1 flagellar biosynthesis protein FlgD [Pluralibacter gergoviae]EKV0916153.1 flagellar biosynthesis protein FlgD [Pluralibacter gergoviae]EKV0931907.1 flagellar biosynthesis protein FlgD [Pluralibacter gergoviae]EKV6248250.1 flagellar biosynthesis protein FlgD [Pluralibacter gergoviae]EKV9908652.1 flagellar biosynthesis protein FlgD [Pluralibacter gergoviae]